MILISNILKFRGFNFNQIYFIFQVFEENNWIWASLPSITQKLSPIQPTQKSSPPAERPSSAEPSKPHAHPAAMCRGLHKPGAGPSCSPLFPHTKKRAWRAPYLPRASLLHARVRAFRVSSPRGSRVLLLPNERLPRVASRGFCRPLLLLCQSLCATCPSLSLFSF